MNLENSNLDSLSDDNLRTLKEDLQILLLEQQLEVEPNTNELPTIRLEYYQKRISILLGNNF